MPVLTHTLNNLGDKGYYSIPDGIWNKSLYDCKVNTIFINNTYWKDSGHVPGSSNAESAISLRISDASMEFFHANLRRLAFDISSAYSSSTSENWRRSSNSVSCGSLPEILIIACHKLSWHLLVVVHHIVMLHTEYHRILLTETDGIVQNKPKWYSRQEKILWLD